MSDTGKLVYKHGNGSLAYKKAGEQAGSLVYKADLGSETTITFAWGSDGKDLDICAYWDDAPALKVGYGYNSTSGDYSSGAYFISYSGDIRGTDTSEWVRIIKRPWAGAPTSFTVRLNFYGHDTDHQASTCAVIVSQANGETKTLFDVPCGTNGSNRATDADPGIRVTFDSSGFLDKVETI